jgi:uncharacterized membrane protein YkvA (DUF1232 family)
LLQHDLSRWEHAVRDRLRQWARDVTRDVYAVYLARRDPRVPWYAKALAVCVAAYAFSPIDLIPDFIPILGLADELVILPLGVLLVVKMIPGDVMAEHRAQAAGLMERPASKTAATVIVTLWIAVAALGGWLAFGWLV